MSIDPHVMKVMPREFDPITNTISPRSKRDSVTWVYGEQTERVNRWVDECIDYKIPDDQQRDDYCRALWDGERVFQVTLEDIKHFKEMMEVPWRKSKLYGSRYDYHASYVEDYTFYIKVRLALRAGYIVVIQWV